MKKTLFGVVAIMAAGAVCAQTAVSGQEYMMQQSVDAQIEAVRQNYEDVKAQAEAKLRAERAAQAKAKAKAEARARAAARERAKKEAKLEKRRDEAAELDLELKRLKVREERSRVKASEAINEETANRAGDIVDVRIQKEGGRSREPNRIIEAIKF